MKFILALAAVILPAISGCSSNYAQRSTDSISPETSTTRLMVENEMPVSLRVYAIEGGSQIPLGRVSALSSASVDLQFYNVQGAVRFAVTPLTSRGRDASYSSEPIEVVEGQKIVWRLHASPGVSDVPRVSSFMVSACGPDNDC